MRMDWWRWAISGTAAAGGLVWLGWMAGGAGGRGSAEAEAADAPGVEAVAAQWSTGPAREAVIRDRDAILAEVLPGMRERWCRVSGWYMATTPYTSRPGTDLRVAVEQPLRASVRREDGSRERRWWYAIGLEVVGPSVGVLVVELVRANGDGAGWMVWDLSRCGGSGYFGGWADVPPVGAREDPQYMATRAVKSVRVTVLGTAVEKLIPEVGGRIGPTVFEVPDSWTDVDLLLDALEDG